MPRTIYVSMLPYNWRKTFDSFDAKVMSLIRGITEGPPTSDDARPLNILLASEYMFRRNPMSVVKKPGDSSFMTDKDDIAKFPPPKSPTTDHHAYRHSIHSAAEKDQLIFRLCMATARKNVMVVAGSMVWAEKEPVWAGSTLTAKGEVLNTTFIVYNGSLVCSYNKSADVSELDKYERGAYKFKVGSQKGGIFVADGISFGIEICGDHGGIKFPSPSSADATEVLDIHMLVSDGASFAYSALRQGGYGLHCDRSSCDVWKADKSMPGKSRVTASSPLNWVLSLDEA